MEQQISFDGGCGAPTSIPTLQPTQHMGTPSGCDAGNEDATPCSSIPGCQWAPPGYCVSVDYPTQPPTPHPTSEPAGHEAVPTARPTSEGAVSQQLCVGTQCVDLLYEPCTMTLMVSSELL